MASVAPYSPAVTPPQQGDVVWIAHPHAPVGQGHALLTAIVRSGEERWLVWTDPSTGDWRDETVTVADTLDDSLAILAPRLALALEVHADWLRREPTATTLTIDPYDTIGFLLHQIVAQATPALAVTAHVAGRIQAEIAEAFGATTVASPDPVVRVHGAPTAQRVRIALIALAAQRWRYAPGVTLGASEPEWRAALGTDAVDHGLEAVVHP